jgi:alpha-galactosidase/6-phospho-beta-glucosidase family protein
MALNQFVVNGIFTKLGLPTIRRTTSREQIPNEYGDKPRWIIEQDTCMRGSYLTLARAVAANLEMAWEMVDVACLTEKERQILREVPSNVARLI